MRINLLSGKELLLVVLARVLAATAITVSVRAVSVAK